MTRYLLKTGSLGGKFIAAALLTAAGWFAAPTLYAQEAKQPAPAATGQPAASEDTETEEETANRRLPTFYSQVVAPYQRKKIYAIQDRYEEQIKVLQDQINALIAKRDAEIDAVLVPEQLEVLKQLKAEAAQRSQESSRKKTESTPAATNAPPAAPARTTTAAPKKATTGGN